MVIRIAHAAYTAAVPVRDPFIDLHGDYEVSVVDKVTDRPPAPDDSPVIVDAVWAQGVKDVYCERPTNPIEDTCAMP
jgi:hypothetical protein